MLGIFSRKKEIEGVGTYDPGLIKKFHKDHEKLVKIVTAINDSVAEGNDKKARKMLKKLKTAILYHFMEEDINLYWYLNKYYKGNKEVLGIVESFETSIKEIQNTVTDFLDYYVKEDVALDNEFKVKFKELVNVLAARIEIEEEKLYTLYKD